jgi:hypothetical protein
MNAGCNPAITRDHTAQSASYSSWNKKGESSCANASCCTNYTVICRLAWEGERKKIFYWLPHTACYIDPVSCNLPTNCAPAPLLVTVFYSGPMIVCWLTFTWCDLSRDTVRTQLTQVSTLVKQITTHWPKLHNMQCVLSRSMHR